MERFCTACGKALEKDASFCGACGKSLKRDDASAAGGSGQANATSSDPQPGGQNADPAAAGGSAAGQNGAASQTTRPSRPAAALPPESVFASATASGGTAADSAGGGIPPEPDPAYFDEGSSGEGGNQKYWIGGAGILILILAALYYWLFLSDDIASSEGGRPTAVAEKPEEKPVETQLFYASTTANIRDKASAAESEILGKLGRGDEARGMIIQAQDDGGNWLKLEDDAGFVFMANLAEDKRPELATDLGRKRITLAAPANLLTAPSDDAGILDGLSKGLGLTISGITANDYAEVLLRKGGVGYIANGAKVVKDGDGPKGPAIAIKLDVQRCPSGDVDALFKKLDGDVAAELKKIEDADYPDDDARQAALDKYYGDLEGKSRYLKLERSFEGLQVSGIARHYEAQALYFADSPEKVRAVFKKLGYKVAADGTLDSRDISAGIYDTRGEGKKYGKTALECGV